MPEAAVDEDGEFFADVGNVGADKRGTRDEGQVTRGGPKTDAAVETIAAEAGVPEGFAEDDLRNRVLGLIRAHHAGDGFGLWRRGSFVARVHEDMVNGER